MGTYAVILLAFYLIPLLMESPRPVLLMVLPIIVFGASLWHTLTSGYQWYFPLITSALFIPSIFIFFNDSALIYAALYAILSLVGQLIGKIFRKR